VLANPDRLKKVLFNLLSNAIKYNRPGGEVILECAPAEGGDRPMFRFCVKDTGIGISAESLSRLFTPFDRLDVEHTRIHSVGSGLGLALSKRMIELMGGRIGVESARGKGSTFWIEIPWAESPGALLVEKDSSLIPDPQSTMQDSKTLLYIEDDLSLLRLMTRIVARRPAIRLLSAASSAMGVEIARERRPDLVLLDLRLPDSNGTEVLKLLRSDPRTSEIPVVVLADNTPEQREQMLSAGARVFLSRPVEVRAILGAIDRFIEFQPENVG
jgi:CheY-like chemotaxis protein